MNTLWSTATRIGKILWTVLRVVLTPIRLPFNAYAHWLHTRWPAGTTEKLPAVHDDGTTNVPGLFVVGDLTGVPLLKLAADSGARAVQQIVKDRKFRKQRDTPEEDIIDLVIIGGGVSGMAAALEAKKQGLRFQVFEGSEPFSTIINFPKAKPIYTYPTDMVPTGDIQFTATVKEPLLDELRAQTSAEGIAPRIAMVEKVVRRGNCFETVIRNEDPVLARRAIVAIGRSGNFRKLGVPGEDRDKVSNRLHDPKDFCGKTVLVVGGGDSAMETAIAIAECGGQVKLSYRKATFSRPKPANIEAIARLRKNPMAKMPDTNPASDRVTTATGSYLDRHRKAGCIDLHLESTVKEITEDSVILTTADGDKKLANQAVFTMIGRQAPLDFFRRSGVKIRGETRGLEWIPITLFFLVIWFIFDWKNNSPITNGIGAIRSNDFPLITKTWLAGLGEWWNTQVADRTTVVGTLAVSATGRSFYYTLLYTFCIGWFGVRRVFRRRTPYVTLQTMCLFAVQAGPLFLLPELLLPWLGYNDHFDAGLGQQVARELFSPLYISQEAFDANAWGDGGHPMAYWRAYGFILAFPLMIYNVLTPGAEPYMWWLYITAFQIFFLIPLMVWKWGKGAFCGWVCSCGGLAETMGDAHRQKMFHGATSNKWNMLGQVILWAAFAMLILRMLTWWVFKDGWLAQHLDFYQLTEGYPFGYKWVVDVLLGGILGVGLYFKYSGRLWCRFACPLAALMHIYARFSKFRIIADKKKCISCNVCTSNCHMGIDVMSFANKGMPMEDTECVRCSACVQTCPTGVLQFGEIAKDGSVIRTDKLTASHVVRSQGVPEPASPP